MFWCLLILDFLGVLVFVLIVEFAPLVSLVWIGLVCLLFALLGSLGLVSLCGFVSDLCLFFCWVVLGGFGCLWF